MIGVPPDRYGEVTSINQTAQRMANAAGTALANGVEVLSIADLPEVLADA